MIEIEQSETFRRWLGKLKDRRARALSPPAWTGWLKGYLATWSQSAVG